MVGKYEHEHEYGRGPARVSARGRRDRSDPAWRAVERAQRGRLVLDVTAADLDAAEAALGPFHPTAAFFREAWYEARRAWDRLRAELGGAKLDAALEEPPRTVLALGPGAEEYTATDDGRWPMPTSGRRAPVLLVLVSGRTYQVMRTVGTPLAPIIWRLVHLRPSEQRERVCPRPRAGPEDGPYHACRLGDGSTQCDCAEWVYRVADVDHPGPAPTYCKHLDALAALGWL